MAKGSSLLLNSTRRDFKVGVAEVLPVTYLRQEGPRRPGYTVVLRHPAA